MTADPALVTRRTTPVGSEVSSSRFQASRPPGVKIVIDQLGTVQIDSTTYRTDSAIDQCDNSEGAILYNNNK